MFTKIVLVVLCSIGVWSQTNPKVLPSIMSTGYIPAGFDSNDQVQVVVEGAYHDTCSKPAGVRINVNSASKTISLSPYEYRYQGLCLDVIVPHDEVVNIGIVPPGNYRVTQANGAVLGRLNVNLAKAETADDFLYAPISQSYVRNVGGKLALTISGVFTNSCMRMQKVLSHVNDNVVVVQPIAELTANTARCTQGNFPFEYSTYLTLSKRGRYLLHVRSLNGRSVNNLFDWR